MLFLILTTLLPFAASWANNQCMCRDYEPCIREMDIPLQDCFSQCQTEVRNVPPHYTRCLSSLLDSMDKVRECSKTHVHDGCTVNKYNVAQVRKFDEFVKAGKERMSFLADKIKLSLQFPEDGTVEFNKCLGKCFFIAEDECTKQFNCALEMPEEQQMLTNIRECALEIDPRLFLDLTQCLSLVTSPLKKIFKEKEEIRSFRKRS